MLYLNCYTFDPPQSMHRVEGLGLGKKHTKFQLSSIKGTQVMISKRNTNVNVSVNLNVNLIISSGYEGDVSTNTGMHIWT